MDFAARIHRICGGVLKWGNTPIAGWFKENPIQMDDEQVYPPFWKPQYGNPLYVRMNNETKKNLENPHALVLDIISKMANRCSSA